MSNFYHCLIRNPIVFSMLFLFLLNSGCVEKKNEQLNEKKLTNRIAIKSCSFKLIDYFILEEDAGHYLVMPWKINIDKNGNMYLLDTKQACIFVFSPTGKFIRKIGKKGSAQDEFVGLFYFDMYNDLIICSDHMGQKFSIFDTLGIYQKSFKCHIDHPLAHGDGVLFGDDSTYLYMQIPYPDLGPQKDNISSSKIVRGSLNEVKLLDQSEQYYIIMKDEINLTEYIVGMGNISKSQETGNIYLHYDGIPYVLEFNKDLELVRKVNVTTPITKLRLSAKGVFDTTSFSSICYHGIIGEYNLLFVIQDYLANQGDTYHWNHNFYLSIYDINYQKPQAIVTDLRIPFDKKLTPQSMAIDVGPDGFVYILENDQPDNFRIGKYRMVIKYEDEGAI